MTSREDGRAPDDRAGQHVRARVSIAKEFAFSASHVLETLPAWHPCARLHGHNYVVVLELIGSRHTLTESGFVRDYGDLDPFARWLGKTVDHRHLNEIMPGAYGPPSAENLAIWFFEAWAESIPELAAVRVHETPKTWAEYRPDRTAR